MMMNLGHLQPNRPSMGSWLIYGLGSENQNLPGFVAIVAPAQPRGGIANWGNGFLPGVNAGATSTWPRCDPNRCSTTCATSIVAPDDQRRQVDLLQPTESLHMPSASSTTPQLEARIASMEMAFRMQSRCPKCSTSPARRKATLEHVRRQASTPRAVCWPGGWSSAACASCRSHYGRRLRIPGHGHDDIENGTPSSPDCDQAIAGSAQDLKQRGLLEDTLVVWGGEFGRTPTSEGQQRPRPRPLRLHHLAGRRRRQGRALLRRRPTEFGLRRREPRPRPRPPRHDPAPDGPRSRAAHLSLLGPRYPADGRARAGGE